MMNTDSMSSFWKPIAPYLDDSRVMEILINGPQEVWIDRDGLLLKTEVKLPENGLLEAVRALAREAGHSLTDDEPQLHTLLPDGSSLDIVLPPIAPRGPTISIRKPLSEKLTLEGLLKARTLTAPMARLLEAAVHLKLNILVTGDAGSGKTTLLNALASMIPNDERIFTLEESAELELPQMHVIPFLARPLDSSAKSAVDLRELTASILRLRPDRLLVGQTRGAECFQLLQAMNGGRLGTLAICPASTPTDALRRFESLCLGGAQDPSIVAVRSHIASAVQLIVSCQRLRDGSRKVNAISEVLPLDQKGDFRLQDLFVHIPAFRGEAGQVAGYHAPTGRVPALATRARSMGFTDLDDSFFDPATYDLPPPEVQPAESVPIHWAPSLKHRERGLPDSESSKRKATAWERKLRNGARARAAPAEPSFPIPVAHGPPAKHPQPSNGPAASSRAPSGNSEPRRESKVELSPDLLAELDSLGVTGDIAPMPPSPVELTNVKMPKP